MINKTKIYVSHSIRGKFGKDATHEQMVANCKKAIRFGHWLKQSFPDVEWYIPADHDEFVTIAYEQKWLTEKQILDVDCIIVRDTCSGILFYMPDDYLSGGMRRERIEAIASDKPMLDLPGELLDISNELPELEGYNKIAQFIAEIISCQGS